jgi:hypothetical protein
VDQTEVLIATPRGFKEELRSGTWACVRYPRKAGRPMHIVRPDRSVRASPRRRACGAYAVPDGRGGWLTYCRFAAPLRERELKEFLA